MPKVSGGNYESAFMCTVSHLGPTVACLGRCFRVLDKINIIKECAIKFPIQPGIAGEG